MSAVRRWNVLPSRTRVLTLLATAVVLLAVVYNAGIHPLLRSIAERRAAIQTDKTILASLSPERGAANPGTSLAEKALAPLSAAPIVLDLTRAAHESSIARVSFRTGNVQAAGTSRLPAAGPALMRLPVTVDLETSAGAFAGYLERLRALSFPLSVLAFDMKRAPTATNSLRIRLELEVFGVAA
ncbi:MAG: hypothetical protein A2Y95_11705 [Deltaproteobacteria bacterium RBG_13_65_10]|nr:MAG: hypothetical protein A2Y95_11705 [Deltaproteobacteria bacterium RBG_13_65_10]